VAPAAGRAGHPAELRRRDAARPDRRQGLAMRVAMGFPLKADEAYRIGLAQWLVPHDS
jgi:hypothetical protein